MVDRTREKGEIRKEIFSLEQENERRKLAELIQEGQIVTMHSKEATLEEIFIKVTGKGLDADETVE